MLLSNTFSNPARADGSFTVHQVMQGTCTDSSVGSNTYPQENAFDFERTANSGDDVAIELVEGVNCNLVSVEVNGILVDGPTFEQIIPIEENGLVVGSIHINGSWDSETKVFTFLNLSDNVTIKGIFEYSTDSVDGGENVGPVDPPITPRWDLDITVNGHYGISSSQIAIEVQNVPLEDAPSIFDDGDDIYVTLAPALGWQIESVHILEPVETDLSEFLSNQELWTDQGFPIQINDIDDDYLIAVHIIRDPSAVGEIYPAIFFEDLIYGEARSLLSVNLEDYPINLNFVERLKGRLEYFIWNTEHTIQVRKSCQLDSLGNLGISPDWEVFTGIESGIRFNLLDIENIEEQSGCEDLSDAIKESNDNNHLPKLFISLWYESEGVDVRFLESNPVHIYFPPVIEAPIEIVSLELGGRYKFNSSFRENIAHVNLEIFEYETETQRYCSLENTVNHLEDFDEDGGIWVTLPTVDEVNSYCEDFVAHPIDPNLTHEIFFWFSDINGDYSDTWDFDAPYFPLSVGVADELDSGTENSSSDIEEAGHEPVVSHRVHELISENSQTTEEKKKTAEVKIESQGEHDQSALADIYVIKKVSVPSWCNKIGIWIYTVSGKLRLCDPEKKTGIEMKACTGRDETPTYPWIFKPQKFVSGSSKSKSGVLLSNAIFFFKGLAISGAENVPDKRCSRGSVFIPNQYSKQVFKFAKQKHPTIWVKES